MLNMGCDICKIDKIPLRSHHCDICNKLIIENLYNSH